MTRLGIIFGTVIVLIAGGLTGFWIAFPSYTHRYRLAIEVEVDGQVKSASSVIEVTWRQQPMLGDAPPWTSSVKGQAVLVDLGRHGALIATLYDANFLALHGFGTFPNRPRTFPPNRDGLRGLARTQGRVALQPGRYLQLAWLPEIGNPSTARLLGPNDLSSVVAPSVRLRGAWIELTTAPIVADLSLKLPWLRAAYQREKDHGLSGRPDEFKLSAFMLIRGIEP